MSSPDPTVVSSERLEQIAEELQDHAQQSAAPTTAVLHITLSALIPMPLKAGEHVTPEQLLGEVRDYLIGELSSPRLSTTLDSIALSALIPAPGAPAPRSPPQLRLIVSHRN